MNSVSLGAAGALRVDEKFHIESLIRANGTDAHVLESTCFAIADDKGRVARLDSDFTVKKSKRTFLGANYKLVCDSVPAKISVTAVTPFLYGKFSQIPAALFSFKIKNTSKKKRTFCFGALAENCSEDSLHEVFRNDGLSGVQLGPASKLSVQSGFLTQCIALECDAKTASYVSGDAPFAAFCEMLCSGRVEAGKWSLPTDKACAAVFRSIEVPAGESVTLNAIYAWYEPNLEIRNEAGESLRFKCGVASAFNSSKSVASYVLKNAKEILLQAELLSSAVESCLNKLMPEYDCFKALEDIYLSAPLRFDEFGNGKMFYKNPFVAPSIYAKSAPCLLESFAYLDADYVSGLLNWQLQYCVSEDGKVTDLPRLSDKVLHFECENAEAYEKQLSMIFLTYKLVSLGCEEFVASVWNRLLSVWKYLQSTLNVDEEAYLVHDSDGVCDVFKTCMYILGAICMMKLAASAEEHGFADAYETIVDEGLGFIRKRAFNGKFYSEFYPMTTEKTERCSLKQVIPFVIANLLGICLVDEKQLEVALGNIYAINYNDADVEHCGVKLYSDSDEIDADAEELYMLALMQTSKMNLASLVGKARLQRGLTFGNHYLFPILEAINQCDYCFEDKKLKIGEDNSILFRGNSLILLQRKKSVNVIVFGEPIRLSRISGLMGKIKNVCVADTEYMFLQKGDSVYFKSMLTLKEGEILNINFNK